VSEQNDGRFGKAPNVEKPIENAADVAALFFPGSLKIAAFESKRQKESWVRQTHLKQAVHSHQPRNFREIGIHCSGQHEQVFIVEVAAAEI
jgi:hypothetical protein